MRSAFVVLALVGCGEVSDSSIDANGSGSDARGDGGSIDGMNPDGPTTGWAAAMPVTALNTTSNESSATLTEDQLLIYFVSNRPNGVGGSDVYSSARTSVTAAWSTPALETTLSTVNGETSVAISRDGLEIFVASDRVADQYRIYSAKRASRSATWPSLTLSSLDNGGDGNSAGSLTDDALTAYTLSDATSKYRIYTATRPNTSTAWGVKTQLSQFNTTDGEGPVAVNGTNTILMFAAGGGLGGFDIWMATRAQPGDAWGAPEAVTSLNTTGNESPTWLSSNGTVVYFNQMTGATSDIMMSTR